MLMHGAGEDDDVKVLKLDKTVLSINTLIWKLIQSRRVRGVHDVL